MKKAMTMGELLVTMAIIGIIAVLVLPGFLKDYHKKQYVAHLKKVYEMLEVAVNQACIDNNVSYFYQTPYGQYKTGGANQQEFIDTYFKTTSSASTSPFSASYRTLSDSTTAPWASIIANSGYGKLAGGEAISMSCAGSDYICAFWVDINATDGPNIVGRDFFVLYLITQTNEILDTYSASSCGSGSGSGGVLVAVLTGTGCFARILQDNWEMNY